MGLRRETRGEDKSYRWSIGYGPLKNGRVAEDRGANQNGVREYHGPTKVLSNRRNRNRESNPGVPQACVHHGRLTSNTNGQRKRECLVPGTRGEMGPCPAVQGLKSQVGFFIQGSGVFPVVLPPGGDVAAMPRPAGFNVRAVVRE